MDEVAGEQAARLSQVGQRFDELADLLMSARSGPPDPGRVVQFAALAVPHMQHVGLTLVRAGTRPATVAATGALPRRVDEIQYETGEGPCLDTIARHDVTEVADLAGDTQWPAFSSRCVAETGVRSMFSLRLHLSSDDQAAMNFYAERPGAFDDTDVAVGAMFAPLAALATQSLLSRLEVLNLHHALQTSRQIGVAIGIVMTRRLITYDQAYAELLAASQRLDRNLHDIAIDIAESGRLPDRPVPRGRVAGH